jgi:hypothetical protein
MTHVEELHRELLQVPGHFATIFHADTSLHPSVQRPTSTSGGMWKVAILCFRSCLPEGVSIPQQQVFQTKACEPFTTLQRAELMQFGGRLYAVVVAADITRLQRVEEARFALARRLIFPASANGPFLEVTLQEIIYEGTKAICTPSNCR